MKPLFGKKKTRKQYEKNVYLFGLPGELEPVMHILCDTFGTDEIGRASCRERV